MSLRQTFTLSIFFFVFLKIIQSTFKSPLIYHDDVMPSKSIRTWVMINLILLNIVVDDFSSGYTYESHLGRFCKNVVAVSARHPHSFFLQTLDDLTQSDNFFSKMKLIIIFFYLSLSLSCLNFSFLILVNFIIVVLMLHVWSYRKQLYV